tara:strand:- start:11960 stop:13204 length:1245 start_codon:yes stop_codon:yes gene_type:complete
MATNLIDVELQSPFQNQPIGETGLDLGKTSIAQDPFKFGEKVAQIDVGRQFGQLLDKGQEGMIATANALISEGTFTAEELQGLDPNLPAFQSEKGQIAWYTGIKQKINAKAKAKSEAEIQERRVQANLPGATEEQKVRSGAERDITVKEMTGLTEAIQTTKNEEIFETLISAIPEDQLIEMEPAALAQQMIEANPALTKLDAFDDLTKFLNARQNRLSREREARLTREDKKKSVGKKDANVAGTIQLLLDLGDAAGSSGRVGGIIRKIKGAAGFDEKARLLGQYKGALAGNIAKGVGGESGRLTDQDRIFALGALPDITDTDGERAVKVRILEAIKTNLLEGDKGTPESRKRLTDAVYGGIGKLRSIGTQDLPEITQIPSNPTDRELQLILMSQDVLPTPENITALREEAKRVK